MSGHCERWNNRVPNLDFHNITTWNTLTSWDFLKHLTLKFFKYIPIINWFMMIITSLVFTMSRPECLLVLLHLSRWWLTSWGRALFYKYKRTAPGRAAGRCRTCRWAWRKGIFQTHQALISKQKNNYFSKQFEAHEQKQKVYERTSCTFI